MADTIPRHNQNTVDLSLLLNDAVTGADNGLKAEADGAIVSATQKNLYLAQAYRWLPELWGRAYGVDRVASDMPGLLKSQSLTIVGSVADVNKDRLMVKNVVKNGVTTLYSEMTPDNLSIDRDAYLTYAFYLFGDKYTVVERTAGVLTAINNSTSYTALYIKAERVDATTGSLAAPNQSANSEDVTLDLKWHAICVHYAAMIASLHMGDDAYRVKAQSFRGTLMDMLPPDVRDKV